jgi:hypothetical protein
LTMAWPEDVKAVTFCRDRRGTHGLLGQVCPCGHCMLLVRCDLFFSFGMWECCYLQVRATHVVSEQQLLKLKTVKACPTNGVDFVCHFKLAHLERTNGEFTYYRKQSHNEGI